MLGPNLKLTVLGSPRSLPENEHGIHTFTLIPSREVRYVQFKCAATKTGYAYDA